MGGGSTVSFFVSKGLGAGFDSQATSALARKSGTRKGCRVLIVGRVYQNSLESDSDPIDAKLVEVPVERERTTHL